MPLVFVVLHEFEGAFILNGSVCELTFFLHNAATIGVAEGYAEL